MRISEIITHNDQQHVNSLDRSANQASYAVKQERYRQRLKRYSDKMRKAKPGLKRPKRLEPPNPPQLSKSLQILRNEAVDFMLAVSAFCHVMFFRCQAKCI